MNILHQYTFQSLKVNRRRTLFTGMGIVISVAMITAVSVFASFLDYMEPRRFRNGRLGAGLQRSQ
ncbi:MAG: hypothetical protein ACLSFJ_04180 [Holdemania filiformis]